jgi:hypothetical protein
MSSLSLFDLIAIGVFLAKIVPPLRIFVTSRHSYPFRFLLEKGKAT